MAEKTDRKPGTIARWREKRKLRRARRRPGMDSRIDGARERNLDSGSRGDPGGTAGAAGGMGGPG